MNVARPVPYHGLPLRFCLLIFGFPIFQSNNKEAYHEPSTFGLNCQLLTGESIAYICHRTSSIVFVPTALGRASLKATPFSTFNIGSVMRRLCADHEFRLSRHGYYGRQTGVSFRFGSLVRRIFFRDSTCIIQTSY